MKKVSEMVDLSKKVLDINIESPVFNSMLNDLNKEIQRGIAEVYHEDFETVEITLKLTLNIENGIKEIPGTNEFGEMVNEIYRYKKPHFKHVVTTTLKQQFKQEGVYTEEKEVQCIDGEYRVVPIYDPQVRIEDLK